LSVPLNSGDATDKAFLSIWQISNLLIVANRLHIANSILIPQVLSFSLAYFRDCKIFMFLFYYIP